MEPVYIIAEAGVNHNGDLGLAKALIDAAAKAGANAVKFQTFRAANLACMDAEKAAYQKETTDALETQYKMLKKLELDRQMHVELMEYCKKRDIQFLSAPFDIKSAQMLVELGVSAIKIPSGEITNYPYLKAVARMEKDIILSTGMSSMDEVRMAVGVLKSYGAGCITALHCNTQYPTPVEDVNLRAMVTMREKLLMPVGYSDHTQGIEVSVAAVALGASVIEKHITLDRGMKGPDHRASTEPQEFSQMVRCIRNIEKAMGKAEKKVSPSEIGNIAIARKSIVAARQIRKGEIFTQNNLDVKRPGTGITPMMWDMVVGQVSDRDYEADERICLEWNPDRSKGETGN